MAHRRQGNAPERQNMDPSEVEEILQLLESMISGGPLPDVKNGPSLPPIKTLEPVKRDEELPPGMGYVTDDQGAKRPERFSSGTIPGPQIDDFPVSKKLKPEKVPIRRKLRMR
jgi:hypothetical protein